MAIIYPHWRNQRSFKVETRWKPSFKTTDAHGSVIMEQRLTIIVFIYPFPSNYVSPGCDQPCSSVP